MNTGDNLTSYRDYEQIMIRLAKDRGWEFEFAGESVPAQSVFNPATYAPAFLVAAGAELAAREIPCDLAFEVAGEPNSLFGARASFPQTRNTVQAQIMRISTRSRASCQSARATSSPSSKTSMYGSSVMIGGLPRRT